MSAFFVLHRDLPREGPGEPADVAWVAQQVAVPAGGRILDAGCGPGADMPALLEVFRPRQLLGVDGVAHFVAEAQTRFAEDPRVVLQQGDMLKQDGLFDLIWCAGAIYFAGITASLQAWRPAVAPEGLVAFSTPAFFTDAPSAMARAFWEGEGDIPTLPEMRAQIAAAGFDLIAERPLRDAAWNAYYQPMEARIAALRAGADAALAAVLDAGLREVEGWRAARAETGYQLCVVRPI